MFVIVCERSEINNVNSAETGLQSKAFSEVDVPSTQTQTRMILFLLSVRKHRLANSEVNFDK